MKLMRYITLCAISLVAPARGTFSIVIPDNTGNKNYQVNKVNVSGSVFNIPKPSEQQPRRYLSPMITHFKGEEPCFRGPMEQHFVTAEMLRYTKRFQMDNKISDTPGFSFNIDVFRGMMGNFYRTERELVSFRQSNEEELAKFIREQHKSN